MAQLVEQRIRNAQVVGSSPTISSRKQLASAGCFLLQKTPMLNEHRGLDIAVLLFDFTVYSFIEESFNFLRGLFVNK